MKKVLMKIIICLMCIIILPFSATAADSLHIISWHGDYDNMKLVIDVKSLVNYVQQVTAVMYPKSSDGSIDVCERMTEITLNSQENATISFVIADDLDAEKGEYIIRFHGSGYLGSTAAEEVVIIRPSSDLLSRFNSATEATLDGCISEANIPLQLNAGESPRNSVRLQKFLNIRNYDYNNSFSSLQNVKDAWIVSDVIAYLAGNSINGSELKTKIEDNASFFDINITAEDYIQYADAVYSSLASVSKSYKNGTGIQSVSDLNKAFKSYLAMNVINGSTWEDIESDITSYYADLDISMSTYNSFTSFSVASRQKVLRQIFEKNFTEPGLIKTAFEEGVGKVSLETPPDDTPTNPGTQSNSTGGASYGISSYNKSDEITNTDFPDCGSSHWAYSYVKSLRENNIVSGYQDGNFYPGNNVTREEFVKMIISAVGLYNKGAQCEFSDVADSAWYYPYIASAQTEDIIQGIGEDVFGIGNYLTREDSAVIAARILKRFNKADSVGNIEFTDGDSVSEYARESIKLLTGMNILNGFEDMSFRPKGLLTRAETAKIIYMIKNII